MSTRSYLALVMGVAVAMPGLALVYPVIYRERALHALRSSPWECAISRGESGISTRYRIYGSGDFAVLELGKVRIAVPGSVPWGTNSSGGTTIRRGEDAWTITTDIAIRTDGITSGTRTGGAARRPGSRKLVSRQSSSMPGADLTLTQDGSGLQCTFNGLEFTVDAEGDLHLGSLACGLGSETVLLLEPELGSWTVLRSDDPRCEDLVGVERYWPEP